MTAKRDTDTPPPDPAADLTTTIAEEGARALYDACSRAFVWLCDLRTDDLLPIVTKQGATAPVKIAEQLAAALDLARKGERRAPRVLIEQICGVIDVRHDAGVNVCKVDYDAGQEVPPAFEDLAEKRNAKNV